MILISIRPSQVFANAESVSHHAETSEVVAPEANLRSSLYMRAFRSHEYDRFLFLAPFNPPIMNCWPTTRSANTLNAGLLRFRLRSPRGYVILLLPLVLRSCVQKVVSPGGEKRRHQEIRAAQRAPCNGGTKEGEHGWCPRIDGSDKRSSLFGRRILQVGR